ncbi:MAG: MFS transporter [Cyanophyceae cyanobacterium]
MGLGIPMFNLMQLVAQIPLESPVDNAEDAALVFSGPQFFTALVAGVLLAFAFQLLLTNLGVAAGISMLGGSDDSQSDDNSGGSVGGTIRKIGFALGLATLITVTISLFFASLFAVKLSLFVSAFSGAIVGLVIWATYFSVLVFVSSSTVGSLVGSIVNTATSGFQAVLGTATAAIGGQAVNKQVVATAEAAASAVRRELGSAIDPITIRENVEDYINALKAPTVDRASIRADFERLLEDPSVQEIAGAQGIERVNRQTFVELLNNRTDLSKRDIESIADELEVVWNRKVRSSQRRDSLGELVDYVKSATPDQLVGANFSDKLDSLIEEMRLSREAQQSHSQTQTQQGQGQGPVNQAIAMGMNSLMGMVMGRADLTDISAEQIVNQLKKLGAQAGISTEKLPKQLPGTATNPIRTDVENYILNAYPWQLKSENLEREFRDLLYDPDADPGTVGDALEQISRSDLADWLQQKGLYTQSEIRELSLKLDAVRREVLVTARAAQEREKSLALQRDVEQYLLTTPKENLTPEQIQSEFKPLLRDPDTDYEHLSNRLAQFDRPTFERLLAQRGDLELVEVSAMTNELEIARDRALSESQEVTESTKAQAEALWSRAKSFFQETSAQDLTDKNVQHELDLLFKDAGSTGAASLRTRAARFNRDDLVQLLTQRGDLSQEQANRIADQTERTWTQIRYAPQQLTGKAQEQYSKAESAIADYLRSTGKAELNPEGIKRDLQKLFADPQTGAQAIRNRLASMDRDTLVQLLNQRDDLSEEQINQTIDSVQDTLRSIARTPRRLARRAQGQVQSFQDSIADYLRSTGKDELDPEGITRDVQLLLNDPRAGRESLQERLSQFDRTTLVALLSQREDIAEEDVNQIIDQILSVRDQVGLQVRTIQLKIEAAIENLLDRIRQYLNGLERPELNYEGITTDLRTLLDDPQAGFEALRDRLSQFDRDTLVAIMSSREDMSEADANGLIDRIEQTRNRLLQRAERIQQETLRRLEETKEQARRQAEETRKAAAAASWWLFATALISALASAGAGALAVLD